MWEKLEKMEDLNPSPFTRRQFLKALGVAGGSALVWGAMDAWDMAAASAGRKPVLSGRPENTNVIILGAGIAGLTAAYELGKLGYGVRILEARHRVGGRSFTVRRGDELTELGGERQVAEFDEGQYLNAGPWRLPGHHTGILGYCRELGVSLEMFTNENDAAFVYNESGSGPLAGKRVRMREVKADLRGYVSELLAKAIRQDELDVPLTADDKERLVSYLVHEGYLSSEDLAYRGGSQRGYISRPLAGPNQGVVSDPHDFGALLQSGLGSHFRGIIGYDQQMTMFQPVGGMDQIARGFQRVLGDKITFHVEVQELRQTPDGVRVVYKDKRLGTQGHVTGDYVISTLPIPVMSGLAADFSPRVKEALSAVASTPAGKIGLQMRRRFWEEDDLIYGGHSNTDLPISLISYPATGYHGKKGVLLGYYRSGSGAVPASLLSPRERIEFALEHGSKIHPETYRKEFETGFSVFWHRVEYSLGGWSSYNAAARRDHYPTLLEADGRFYFAGDGISWSPGWQEGAVQSAWHAIEKLHGRVMAG